jgi:hypothetical protein
MKWYLSYQVPVSVKRPVTSNVCSVTAVPEVLSSDEDEIDETNQEYLEKLQRKITKGSAGSPFDVTSYIQV